jgi:hypothetical protein
MNELENRVKKAAAVLHEHQELAMRKTLGPKGVVAEVEEYEKLLWALLEANGIDKSVGNSVIRGGFLDIGDLGLDHKLRLPWARLVWAILIQDYNPASLKKE